MAVRPRSRQLANLSPRFDTVVSLGVVTGTVPLVMMAYGSRAEIAYLVLTVTRLDEQDNEPEGTQ
jgi:hypothetical protein